METQKNCKRRWDLIADRMPKDGVIIGAELGVWKGRMSAKLLEIIPNLELVMVDTWKSTPPGHSYLEGSLKISRLNDEEMEKAYQITLCEVNPYEGRYKIMRMDTAEAAEQFMDNTFDFVFLDGDHSFNGVTRDLQAWVSKVKPGRYICGHDWGHPEQGAVKQAVKKIFENRINDIELDVNRTWFIKL